VKNQKQSIKKIVTVLNNEEEEGGFWLPNIQRPFVWSEDQICKLFDSLMREYPISTLLIWKTKSSIKRRKFIDIWKDGIKLSDYYVPEDSKRKNLVLDGQQRLQSLFIGLKGSYDGKELYFDILSGTLALPDEIKFKFSFLKKADAKFPYVLFKEFVFWPKRNREYIELLKERNPGAITLESEDKIKDNLEIIDRSFKNEDVVSYQELDSIEFPDTYNEDDVVEIFIRANSGGTKLEKSDLLFSLLSSSWDNADSEMEVLLEDLNKYGFQFGRDYILKCCLVLLDQGARYEVEKFRKPGIREQIETEWSNLTDSIRDVVDYLRSKTYIQCDKALSSYNALIPLIYFRYKYPNKFKSIVNADKYLLQTLLAGIFGGQSDSFMDSLTNSIKGEQDFNIEKIYSLIRDSGKSLEIQDAKFLQMGYGSKTIHLIFNLWYPSFSHIPSYDNNLPQVDHVFPTSLLRKEKYPSPDTGRLVMKYKDEDRNQLANCMLLTRDENGAGGKSDIPPSIWFANKSSDYLDKHLIPNDPALWEIENFDRFIDARKELIRNRFAALIRQA
jgi:hypothetical protein